MRNVLEFKVSTYGKGIVNFVEDTLIDDGASSESVNFLTLPDRIELIGGRRLIGAEESGNTGVLGMGEITKVDGEEILFRKIGTKLQYLNNTTQLWIDIKTDLLPNEPLYFANSFTPAGRQVWMCGQDGLFKIYPTNPTSIINLTNAVKNYKGNIIIDKSRMICVGMKEDPTGIRFSCVDKDSNYKNISSEPLADTSTGKKHYSGTLANGQGFGYVFKDGTAQTITDDKNGNLIGNGTGTINYATGEYILDFNSNTATAVKADYLYENPLNGGLADFTCSSSRLAGEGNVLRQDSIGSKTMSVHKFNNTFYTLQDRGSWWISIDTADTKWDNEIYRENIGCPSVRAGVTTAEGIIFIDTYDKDKPKLRLLGFNQLGDQIIPYDLGLNFKLEDYTFDKDTCLSKYGDWILIECKKDSPANNKLIIYNKKLKSFDVADCTANCFIDFNRKVISGDSTSPNTHELFSGYDDLDYKIEAIWKGKKHNFKTDSLKKTKRFRIKGYIDPGQGFDVLASYDNDDFQLIGAISGRGNYIDFGKSYLIGSSKVGEEAIGLGDSSKANYYETEFKIHTPKFERVKLAIIPTGLGYLSIMEHKFIDIRIKANKLPKKYKMVKGKGVGYSSVGSTLTVN
jgi:hypothetical protein